MPRLAGGVSAVGEPRDDAGQGGERAWEPPAGGFVLRCAGRRGPPGLAATSPASKPGLRAVAGAGSVPATAGVDTACAKRGRAGTGVRKRRADRRRGGRSLPACAELRVLCVPNCVSCTGGTAKTGPGRGRDEGVGAGCQGAAGRRHCREFARSGARPARPGRRRSTPTKSTCGWWRLMATTGGWRRRRLMAP